MATDNIFATELFSNLEGVHKIYFKIIVLKI